jgi:predicted phosphodiesterase
LRLCILTDIHANLPALTAVLNKARQQGAQGYISLGDQVCFGPQPCETLALLEDFHVKLLMGNHEERIIRFHNGGQALYEAYNWSMHTWTARELTGVPMDYDMEWRYEDMLLTHAVPGSTDTLLTPADVEKMIAILNSLDVKWLVCGHYHTPWQVHIQDKHFVNPGSLGILDDGHGCQAAYAMWEDGQVTVYTVPYDPAKLKKAYVDGGLAAAAPEMARSVLETMLWGYHGYTPKWINHVQETAKAAGIPWQSREAFHLAEGSFPWTEDISCEEFWRRP